MHFGRVHFVLVLAQPSTQLVTAIRQISVPWSQCDYFVFFFLYIFSGIIYRQQLIRLLKLNKHGNDNLPLVMQKHVIHQIPITNVNILAIQPMNDTIV
jgi:hypothetical protein